MNPRTRGREKVSIAVLSLLVMTGCLEQGPPAQGDDIPLPSATAAPTQTPSSPPPAADPPTIRDLASGSMSQRQDRTRALVSDRETYEAFWNAIREDETMPAPEVDFARETVVIAIADARPNACWSLRITNATAEVVEVTTFTPPPELMCASVITYPWHVVALSGAGRDVEFVESTAQGPPPS